MIPEAMVLDFFTSGQGRGRLFVVLSNFTTSDVGVINPLYQVNSMKSSFSWSNGFRYANCSTVGVHRKRGNARKKASHNS